MDFYEWSFKKSLRVSKQGIPEPFTEKKVFPDVLIVPLVGFDKKVDNIETVGKDISMQIAGIL